MRTVAAGSECLDATIVQVPALGRQQRKSLKADVLGALAPARFSKIARGDENAEFAPYHVRAFRLTLAAAGAMTVPSNPYRAGDGAVIRYRAEERPSASMRLAACGRPVPAEPRVTCWRWL